MQKTKMLYVSALLLFGACQGEELSTPPLPPPSELSKPPALVVTHDISKTFRHVPPPDETLLREWAAFVAEKGGIIAFGLIGNPDSTGALIRQIFHALPAPGQQRTYLDRIRYRQLRDSLQRENDLATGDFVGRCLELLRRHRDHQHTHVNGRFKDVSTFFSEPGMDAYQPFYFTATDGWQDVQHPLLTDTVIRPNLLLTRIKVLTCGWKNPTGNPEWIALESPQALTRTLQSFTSQ